jgi:flagellin-like hook-associated protein FlgL
LKVGKQVSSGKQISTISEDPLGGAKTLDFRTSINSIEQYERNIVQASSFLSYTDSIMSQLQDPLLRARTIAIGQISDTANAQSRTISSEEVKQIFGQILQLANSKLNDRYLFAGSKTDTMPFTDVNGDLEYNDGLIDRGYQGNTQAINLAFGDTEQMPINMDGNELFELMLPGEISSVVLISGQSTTPPTIGTISTATSSGVNVEGDTFLTRGASSLGTPSAYTGDLASGTTTITLNNESTIFQSGAGFQLSYDFAGGSWTITNNAGYTSGVVVSGSASGVTVDLDNDGTVDMTLTSSIALTQDSTVTYDLNPATWNVVGVGSGANVWDTGPSLAIDFSGGTTADATVAYSGNRWEDQDRVMIRTKSNVIASAQQTVGWDSTPVTIGEILPGGEANIDIDGDTTLTRTSGTISSGYNYVGSLSGSTTTITLDNEAPIYQSVSGVQLIYSSGAVPAWSISGAGVYSGVAVVSGNASGATVDLDNDGTVDMTLTSSVALSGANNSVTLDLTAGQWNVTGAGVGPQAVNVWDTGTALAIDFSGGTTPDATIAYSGSRWAGGDVLTMTTKAHVDSIFDIVKNLNDALVANMPDAIAVQLDRFDSALDHVREKLAKIGARMNRMVAAENLMMDVKLNLKGLLSETEDVDMIQAVSDLAKQQTIYEAALRSTALITRMTLLDFL